MTHYSQITSLSIEGLAEWLDEHGQFDGSPWLTWFDKTYCSNCPSLTLSGEEAKVQLGFERPFCIESTCAYCEIHKECKFFPGKETPNNKEIIAMWLKEKAE